MYLLNHTSSSYQIACAEEPQLWTARRWPRLVRAGSCSRSGRRLLRRRPHHGHGHCGSRPADIHCRVQQALTSMPSHSSARLSCRRAQSIDCSFPLMLAVSMAHIGHRKKHARPLTVLTFGKFYEEYVPPHRNMYVKMRFCCACSLNGSQLRTSRFRIRVSSPWLQRCCP